jgi:hypothetical protein
MLTATVGGHYIYITRIEMVKFSILQEYDGQEAACPTLIKNLHPVQTFLLVNKRDGENRVTTV